jgi:hypothetical protein
VRVDFASTVDNKKTGASTEMNKFGIQIHKDKISEFKLDRRILLMTTKANKDFTFPVI